MLYKQLNEKRTQGEWVLSQSPVRLSQVSKLPFKSIKNTKGLGGRILINSFGKNITQSGIEEAESNAAYTALAVNNLHHLAEALEELLEWANIKEGSPSQHIRDKAKQALARIS